ncbi:MAG: hypothetical protein J6B77_03230, partial [Clostridia bacterium]|nr:hypothetical protein [Clostridia bacterium]
RHFASFERQKQENSDHEKAYLRLFHGEAVSNIEFETAPIFVSAPTAAFLLSPSVAAFIR